MMLTTKGRYAVMALVDVADRGGNVNFPVKLADIANSQDIPLNYLEQIFAKLKKAEIVDSVKGPGGGYFLKINIDEITVINIVDAVEENTKMTRCKNGKYCTTNGTKCKTHGLWKGLGNQIRSYLGSISIADILAGKTV